ncbi:exopolyphosphatase [Actinomyces sp. 2119]|uniref:Ppx/GppA phosphatase family protein n=1 Tax=Actinomyces sp. 2119 TaxID=2321393 RepID=UPI000E6D0C7C|nr:exopolyphosphatase [Actinomyces sp. 2119]RJF40974.1 exopolyphosphatase [Actinomyces sp. 2119]
MTRVAAIDCGTNTIRLLVAQAWRDDLGRVRLEPLRRRSQIVRLGQGVDRTGRLDPQALERTLAAVADYAEDCRELGVPEGPGARRFVATSATRDAGNRDDFTAGVAHLVGVEPQVVSGQEEARLSFVGSLLGDGGAGGPDSADAGADAGAGATERLVVDLGGGSTELVLGDREPRSAVSLDTGSVRVTERFLAGGTGPQALACARGEVRALLDQAAEVVDLAAPARLVGLAGTVATVTAHALGLEHFDPAAIDGAELGVEAVLASCEAIMASTPQERQTWGYLAPGRRDVIAAGALVWAEVVGRVTQETTAAGRPLETVTTSLHDILDGIALSLVPPAAPSRECTASGCREPGSLEEQP